jgi:hypothetical protein
MYVAVSFTLIVMTVKYLMWKQMPISVKKTFLIKHSEPSASYGISSEICWCLSVCLHIISGPTGVVPA